MSDAVYYAIGDVHGEDERLARLHDAIFEDHARLGGTGRLIHLGDLVDRGDDSQAVVARCMALEAAPPAGLEIVTLMGNHERMMVDALLTGRDRTLLHWLENGGDATLASYLRTYDGEPEPIIDAIEPAHVAWMKALPSFFRDEARGLYFVHAGIEPNEFPNCDEDTRLWTRSRRFFDETQWPDRPELQGLFVVHGHTPTSLSRPDLGRRRLNIDTGAVFGGPLTCAVLAPGEAPRFLEA